MNYFVIDASDLCSHEFWVDINCLNCGGFMGKYCQNCLRDYDGGDPNFEVWCECDDPRPDTAERYENYD